MPLLAHRFFYAVMPSRRQANLMLSHVDGSRGALLPEHLHATLGITDDFSDPDDEAVNAMTRAGGMISASPFELSLDRLSGSTRSIALRPSRRNARLIDLSGQIAAAMRAVGVPMREGWSFSPHITLAYRTAPAFSVATSPIRWDVVDFVLIHSLVGLTEHRELARWSLDRLPDPGLFD